MPLKKNVVVGLAIVLLLSLVPGSVDVPVPQITKRGGPAGNQRHPVEMHSCFDAGLVVFRDTLPNAG